MKISSAFSFPEEKIRFDHRGWDYRTRQGQTIFEESHRVICLLPDRTIHFTDMNPLSLMLSILPPNTMSIKGHPWSRGYLDPRCLGLIHTNELYKGAKLSAVIEKWANRFAPETLTLTDEGAGIVRATQISSVGRRSIWIDTERGFGLVRFQGEMGKRDPESGDFLRFTEFIEKNEEARSRIEERDIDWQKNKILDVPEEIEIGWVEVGGVWVPSSYHHVTVSQQRSRDRESHETEIVKRETTLNFEWSSVNDELNDELFDYHNFDLPKGTDVFDQRTPKSVFVEQIGSLPVADRIDLTNAGEQSKHRWWIIIGLNTAFVVVLILVLYFRRRHRQA